MAKLGTLIALLLLVVLLVGVDVLCVQAFGLEVRSSVASWLIGVPMGAALLDLEGVLVWATYLAVSPDLERSA
jgi:hypothetical protein